MRTHDQVEQAIDAGAAFLVSQVFRRPLVDAAAARGVPFFPGALTPTEILDAWESGVPAVKVSPIGPVGGLAYFDNLRGPLPDILMMPTGGVELDEVSAYLDKGAVAVGLSGSLIVDALLPGGRPWPLWPNALSGPWPLSTRADSFLRRTTSPTATERRQHKPLHRRERTSRMQIGFIGLGINATVAAYETSQP